MEEKKYVYVVTTGIHGVDDRREVGRFNELANAIKSMNHYLVLMTNEARIESQQVHYRNDKEFTQFDVQIEKVVEEEDSDDYSDIIYYWSTPKFRYGQIVD